MKAIKVIGPMIPYQENTPEWHCLVDCHTSMNAENIVVIEDMIKQHAQDMEYYEIYLPVLIEDGLIEVIE